jgi:NADH-quinone oxidoreductase subunit C
MNTTEAILQTAVELLAAHQTGHTRPEPNRLDVSMGPGDLVAAVAGLQAARWGYLAAITGLDLGPKTGELEVLYHFCSGPVIVTLRVRLPRANAAVPTLAGVIASAELLEHEMSEMLGVDVTGSAYADHLFLPEDWPAGAFPLRKEPLPAGLVSAAPAAEEAKP